MANRGNPVTWAEIERGYREIRSRERAKLKKLPTAPIFAIDGMPMVTGRLMLVPDLVYGPILIHVHRCPQRCGEGNHAHGWKLDAIDGDLQIRETHCRRGGPARYGLRLDPKLRREDARTLAEYISRRKLYAIAPHAIARPY